MSSTSEFWKAINNYTAPPPQIIECRAYYNKNGYIISCHSGPQDGKWPAGNSIVISTELYKDTSLLYRLRVINGELTVVKTPDPRRKQLEPATQEEGGGTYTSLNNNIIFCAPEGDNYKQKEYNVKISNNEQQNI